MRERQVSLLTFEGDVEPEGRARDERMLRKCHQMGVQVHSFATHLLYDPDRVIRELGADELPLSYGPFVARVTEALGAPALPLAAPPETQSFGTPDTDPQAYAVPRLEELEAYRGMTATTPLKGGETTALAVLGAFLSERRDEARQFSKPHTSPTAFEPASTTQLSPHMALGCLSARLFYYRVQELHPLRRPPVSLIGQLWWREFFTTVAYATSGFHSMKENRLCRQIPWSADAEEQYRAWEGGRTGHPFIDACMVQLRKHGWLHHLARHAVACFLSRGDLWVSWERGRDTFDRLLVDRDYALNNANWMWLSCSAFFHGHLCAALSTGAAEYARQVCVRAVEGAVECAAGGWVCGREGLSVSHRGPRGGEQGKPGEDERGVLAGAATDGKIREEAASTGVCRVMGGRTAADERTTDSLDPRKASGVAPGRLRSAQCD
eukprot:ctg_675.g328